MCQLFETKGCHTFSCQERNCILAVANKRKISFYLWLGKGFDHLSDGLLNDVPKIVYCLPQSVIVGYKRCYEVIDVPPISVSKSGLNALGSICTYTQTRTYVLTARTSAYADDNHAHVWMCKDVHIYLRLKDVLRTYVQLFLCVCFALTIIVFLKSLV